MREILFRAKRIDNEEWAYGYYSPDVLEKTDGDSVDWAFIKEQRHEEVTIVTHYVKKATVGQFTGLLDENGRKIFKMLCPFFRKRTYSDHCHLPESSHSPTSPSSECWIDLVFTKLSFSRILVEAFTSGKVCAKIRT